MLGLLTAVLTVAAPVDVVLSRSIDTTPERAQDLLERVTEALAQAGLPVRDLAQTKQLLPAGTVSSKCSARRACVRELGVALGSKAIVGVDVGHVTAQMAVNLEAVSVADGQRLAQHSFAIDSAGYPAGIEAQLKKFTAELERALVSEDAPVAAKLEPAPEPSKTVAAPAEAVTAAPSRPVGPLILGGTAVVATLVAIALGATASSTAGQLERAKSTYQGMPASDISRPQADEIAATANSQYTGAGISAGAAVALGAGALFWWTLGQP